MNINHLKEPLINRDKDAFALYYDTCSPFVYGTLLHVVHDTDIANELLTKIFVFVWKYIPNAPAGESLADFTNRVTSIHLHTHFMKKNLIPPGNIKSIK